MPLHVDYRPETFDEVVGNQQTVTKLRSLIERDEDIPHAFLFTGPFGCGKTTLARIVGYTLGVQEADFYEMNTADYRTLQDARDLSRKIRYKPMVGDRRFWLLDECHKLTTDAQNCMLKITEEPPGHAYICFCTTDPQLLNKGLINRCHTFKVNPLKRSEIIELLDSVLEEEDVEVDEAVLKEIAKRSEGTPRTALTMLDDIIDLDTSDMTEALENMQWKEAESRELAKALYNGEPESKLFKIVDSLEDEDAENIRRIILGWCHKVMKNPKSSKEERYKAYIIMTAFESPTYYMGQPAISKGVYEAHHALI